MNVGGSLGYRVMNVGGSLGSRVMFAETPCVACFFPRNALDAISQKAILPLLIFRKPDEPARFSRTGGIPCPILFAVAIVMTLGVVSEGRSQTMSSAGSSVAPGQLNFRPIDTSKSAAPVSTVAMKNSQGSMMTNIMQKFAMPNFLKSSKPLAPTGPLGRSQAAKTSAQVTSTMSSPKSVACAGSR